jgi:hypothetical protein
MPKTQEQIREGNRIRKQNQRDREREQKELLNQMHKTEQAWWSWNRTENPPSAEALELHETLIGALDWMKTGHEDDPSSEDFTSIEDGLPVVLDMVREFGVLHLGYITRDQEIPRNWCSQRYWSDSTLLKQLAAENSAMKTYVYFGLIQALPDNAVISFLTTRAGYDDGQARAVCGQSVDSDSKFVVYK